MGWTLALGLLHLKEARPLGGGAGSLGGCGWGKAVDPNGLEPGVGRLLPKGPESKYFRFVDSVVSVVVDSSHRQYLKEWV